MSCKCLTHHELENGLIITVITVIIIIIVVVCRWGFRGWSKGCTEVRFCCSCCMLLHGNQKAFNGKQTFLSLSVICSLSCHLRGCVCHSLLVCFLCQRPMLATCLVLSGVLKIHYSDASVCCCNEHVAYLGGLELC